MIFEEIFKTIEGYEGMYEISNYGRVKSLKNNKEYILKPSLDLNGYVIVSLSNEGIKKTKTIHQLVAIAFLNHIPDGMKLIVNHKDFNRQNNHVDNLEIITQRENANLKHLLSSSQYTGVSWHKRDKKWQSIILINNKLKYLGYFNNELEASKAYEEALKLTNYSPESSLTK